MAPPKPTHRRQSWSIENMQRAINAVVSRQMGWLKASKTFNVPKNTLRRRVQGKNKVLKGSEVGFLGGIRPVFSPEVESEMVEHLKTLEARFFGLTPTDLRKLAYQLATKLKLKHRFNDDNQMAGWDWLQGFLKRNRTISVRTPEATSLARAQAFNKVQIAAYFDKLEETFDKYKFTPAQIYNVDESGLSTVQSRTEKILATKGRKQVGILTAAERGQHFTIVCCMNAIGNFIPPALIFPRKNMKAELMDKAPNGSVGFSQEKGYMNGETFLLWLKHFVKHANPGPDNKILLLLDGHGSHKQLPVLEFAKKHNIIMFCFPPHCTHRVQPLDVAVYGPLSSYYNQAVRRWLSAHPGRGITHFQVGELFNEAYSKAASVSNAQSGFSKTGICPFNKEVFPDWMFEPSETTNVPASSEVPVLVDTEIPSCSRRPENPEPLAPPEESKENDPNTDNKVDSPRKVAKAFIEELSPKPHVDVSFTKRKTKKGSKGILNSTPEIAFLQERESENREKERRKLARKVKRRVVLSDDSEDDINNYNDAVDDDDDDPACIYCNSLYSHSRSRESWIRCQNCKMWCHTECAGVNRKLKQFICELCS